MADLATAAADKVDVDNTGTTATDTTATDTGKTDTKTTATADTGAATDKADKVVATTDDWRARMAGGDEKLLGFLGRYPTEKAFAEAAKKDREAARSALKPLSEDPTPEELSAYRATFGVPEKPEGYLDKLSGGLVVGDDDKPIVDKFLAAMHEKNAPAALTDAALQTYYKIVEEQDAAIATAVAEAKVQCEEALRTEFGADYRRNINVAEAHLGTLPAEVQAAINEGFNGKGIPLKADPAVMQWLVGQALEANPLATVVPGAGANQASAVANEIAAIEKTIREDRAAYNADPKMQARYRELLAAREKMPKE